MECASVLLSVTGVKKRINAFPLTGSWDLSSERVGMSRKFGWSSVYRSAMKVRLRVRFLLWTRWHPALVLDFRRYFSNAWRVCMKFYTTIKQSNSRFIIKFGWNLSENDKLMLFQPRQPLHFSAFWALSLTVVCSQLWKEPVCWWWDEDADLQTDRVIADARSDHHWQPQPSHRPSCTWWRSPPPCSRVLMESLPKWSAKRLSTHQLSYASAGVYYTFSLVTHDPCDPSDFRDPFDPWPMTHRPIPCSETTDELKVALQTIWEEMPREHVNKAVANFINCLTVAVAANGGHSEHLQ